MSCNQFADGNIYPEEGPFTKILRGFACQTSKIGLSLYQFFVQLPTHQFTIFKRKAPNLA